MWKLWLVLAALGAIRLLIALHRGRRLRRSGIFEIDQMSGNQFELRLAALFKQMGYHGRVLGRSSGDYGADLLIERDGRRTVVQAKRWKRNVGITAVQEVLGARDYYGADDALVVTNWRFTKAARALAAKSRVELWDRDELVRALERACPAV